MPTPLACSLLQLKQKLTALADPKKAPLATRFFKTGPGEYGAGDQFMGIPVPELRKLVKEFSSLALSDTQTLVQSPWHEERLLGLLLWVNQYKKGSAPEQGKIYTAYVNNFSYINNWDLVDSSAEHITGAYHWDQPKTLLHQWAKSENLWVRRIAMLSTFHYIRKNEFKETLHIAAMLLKDEHDLIHKAVGWLLREVGKRDLEMEEKFLRLHGHNMPRTMLRYAIEKFPEKQRQAYLKGQF